MSQIMHIYDFVSHIKSTQYLALVWQINILHISIYATFLLIFKCDKKYIHISNMLQYLSSQTSHVATPHHMSSPQSNCPMHQTISAPRIIPKAISKISHHSKSCKGLYPPESLNHKIRNN